MCTLELFPVVKYFCLPNRIRTRQQDSGRYAEHKYSFPYFLSCTSRGCSKCFSHFSTSSCHLCADNSVLSFFVSQSTSGTCVLLCRYMRVPEARTTIPKKQSIQRAATCSCSRALQHLLVYAFHVNPPGVGSFL